MLMKRVMLTRGGQISLPAPIRRRWASRAVTVEDLGDHVIVRPAPADPIAAVKGLLADRKLPPAEEIREAAREDERRAEARKWRSSSMRTR
jgi:hypothetical protein